jgi:hypothetical protein
MAYAEYMQPTGVLVLMLAGTLWGQVGQEGPRPGWPCVAGRPVDPTYLEISESTGGQLFLFQKGEVAHASLVMGAPYTHPSTVLRAIGNLSGTRDFEFPVDSSIESLLMMASLQCRNAIRVSRPNGSELTAANRAQSVELQAGRILRVDSPEPGAWKVRLAGTGLFVLSVVAKTQLRLSGVKFSQPRLGVRDNVEARVSGPVSNVKFQLVGPAGELVSSLEATEPTAEGTYLVPVTPPVERFRILMSGTDASGWPVQRTHPVLFRAVITK